VVVENGVAFMARMPTRSIPTGYNLRQTRRAALEADLVKELVTMLVTAPYSVFAVICIIFYWTI
jgi:hypothetical protein